MWSRTTGPGRAQAGSPRYVPAPGVGRLSAAERFTTANSQEVVNRPIDLAGGRCCPPLLFDRSSFASVDGVQLGTKRTAWSARARSATHPPEAESSGLHSEDSARACAQCGGRTARAGRADRRRVVAAGRRTRTHRPEQARRGRSGQCPVRHTRPDRSAAADLAAGTEPDDNTQLLSLHLLIGLRRERHRIRKEPWFITTADPR